MCSLKEVEKKARNRVDVWTTGAVVEHWSADALYIKSKVASLDSPSG